MSAYIIDFSDPLRNGFSIPAGGFNGPGGSSANTTLRLYGRGALEWGEAVDEDLVRLTENFASASSPSSPISGQIWIETTLYYRDTTQGSNTKGWWYYDPNETGAGINKWKQLAGIAPGEVGTTRVDANIEGRYYYWAPGDGISSNIPDYPQGEGLYGFYSLGRYEPAAWRRRSHISGPGAPTSLSADPDPTKLLTFPQQYLRTYSDATNEWSTPSPVNISPGGFPSSPYIGMLSYDPVTGILSIYTASGWQQILGPAQGSNQTISNSIIDMQGNRIINLGAPVNLTDAATKAYVDAAVVSGTSSLYVARSGDSMTGNLTLTGSAGITVGGAAVFQGTSAHTGNATFTTLSSSGTATFNSLSVTNTATVGSTLTVNGTINAPSTGAPSTIAGVSMFQNRITNLAITPASASEATSKSYVDSQIAASNAGALTPGAVALISPAVPKNGDIQVVGTNIYIYASGAYRQVFPAQWAA